MSSPTNWKVAGLFAGIGGIELGLARSGLQTVMMCERWEPAKVVLESHFDGLPIESDIRDLRSLPSVEIVTAGFPCTDLSQAGATKGITGKASGLVGEVFRLLKRNPAQWVVLENVRNMLVLDGGRAMSFLVEEFESLGYRWAYRLVDSRFTGVPQRRQRVVFVASLGGDPRGVLFADDVGEPPAEIYREDSFGFYWTEGLRGLGWAQDAVPTLKGGSTIGIPSPPAIWIPEGSPGRRIVTPSISDAEVLQGFPSGWTLAASELPGSRAGDRWKLVGNAVTVGVFDWLGKRLTNPGEVVSSCTLLDGGARWPTAGYGYGGNRWSVDVSMWPQRLPFQHLSDLIDFELAPSLSRRAASGFLDRARRGSLRMNRKFVVDVEQHLDFYVAA